MKTQILATCLMLPLIASLVQNAMAQAGPPTILQLDETNLVNYNEDIADLTKAATSRAIVASPALLSFQNGTGLGDIVAANGQSVKGTHIIRYSRLNSTPTPSPGQSIADITRDSLIFHFWEIQGNDGTAIGTITAQGFARGTAPPGAPVTHTAANLAITGGTGAFAGIRGFGGSTNPPASVPNRKTSILEDPAFRRVNGGGTARYILTLYPADIPQILAVLHSDLSPVTAASPAVAGETLITVAAGLGPTRPGVDPGQPFPASPLQPINSPVAVTVNGQTAQVVNAIGWPNVVNQYRVDFQVPAGIAQGMANVTVSAAWMAGTAAAINVR